MTTPRTDLSDARWALIEPIMTAWRAAQGGPGIRQPALARWLSTQQLHLED